MTSALPAAVLWDMDGTLVNTEPYWMSAEQRLVERFGGRWTHEQGLELVGLALEQSARAFQQAGVTLSIPEIVDTLTDDVLAGIARDGVPFRPGARELLRSLRDAQVPTALVTMSMHRMAERVVGLIGFDAFDVIVAGDDVRRPKPYPDPYQQACEHLGVDPTEAVAIEDSPNGVAAAVASGAFVLGVPMMVSLTGTGAHEVHDDLVGLDASGLGALHAAHRRAEAERA